MNVLDMAGKVLFTAEVNTIKELIVVAVSKKTDLYRANLRGADLRGADLYRADLYRADLRGADLRGADLYGADLRGADLYGADLYRADLYRADLRGADLYGADLRGADLYGADLYGADLRGANLYGADLRGAKNAELVIARLQFIPVEGEFVAWKKCQGGVIVKLSIPADAKRSHGTERKCRASKAVVLEVIGAIEAKSLHQSSFLYRVGETVEPDGFDDDRWNVCGQGIHFYLTKEEAMAHNV